MRRVLKILGWLVAFHLVLALGLAAWLVIRASRPSSPVGFQQVRVADPGHADIPVLIWYPTDSPPRLILMGNSAAELASNGRLKGQGLPMVILSHGTGGSGLSHVDTAFALAEAGFVVVAPTHPGDNFRDDSAVGTPRWLMDRSRQVRRVSDYMLATWPRHGQLDQDRVGMFGFSAGATTTLISIGGEPDMALLASHCVAHPEFVCQLTKAGGALPKAGDWTHEPRIRAAVVAAPGFGFLFAPEGLSRVSAPVQLWLGSRDDRVPFATNAGVVRGLLPVAPEFHSVSGAGHFGFLTPCTLGPPMICKDPPGFDRAAFQKDFNRQVVAFFRSQLAPGLKGRVDHEQP